MLFATGVLLFFVSRTTAEDLTRPDLSLSGAIAVSSDQARAFVAGQGPAAVRVVNLSSLETTALDCDSTAVVDLRVIPQTDRILAASTTPPALISIDANNKQQPSVTLSLTATPARVEISRGGTVAAVTLTWDHAVALISISSDGTFESRSPERIPLSFPPAEILPLPNERFLVADAFGGRLAVLDAEGRTCVAEFGLNGHHIGGLAIDETSQQVLVTHQRLSGIAQTSQEDIHWGTLMQNLISSIPLARLTGDHPASDAAGKIQQRPIGKVGNGAGDPAGVIVLPEGQIAVALAGTNQVAIFRDLKTSPQLLDVGRIPRRLARAGSRTLLCLNVLESTVSVIEPGEPSKVVHVIESPGAAVSPEWRGLEAFHSARLSHDGWMSCSSCHVDGHTPDLLADTLGDGQFGTPRRVPSLLNSAATAPWGWNGTKLSLEEQILQSLTATMHRDETSRLAGADDTTTAAEIAAYLRTLKVPTRPAEPGIDQTSAGAELFVRRGCQNCHAPDSEFTTPKTWDVGVRDEAGTTLFNPPSLIGLRHRRAYFHDARFKSLDALLHAHPDPTASWTAEEIRTLRAWLLTL